jgi:hypothetical protein
MTGYGVILGGRVSSCLHGNARHRVTNPDPHEDGITVGTGSFRAACRGT